MNPQSHLFDFNGPNLPHFGQQNYYFSGGNQLLPYPTGPTPGVFNSTPKIGKILPPIDSIMEISKEMNCMKRMSQPRRLLYPSTMNAYPSSLSYSPFNPTPYPPSFSGTQSLLASPPPYDVFFPGLTRQPTIPRSNPPPPPPPPNLPPPTRRINRDRKQNLMEFRDQKWIGFDEEEDEDEDEDEEDEYVEILYYSFEIRPCRRLHTDFSTLFPERLSRKPYKYVLKVVTDSSRVGNLRLYLKQSNKIGKFSVAIMKEGFDPKNLKYDFLKDRMDGINARYYRRVRNRERDDNDNLFEKYEHYFEIQFVALSSSKSKTFYKLFIMNRNSNRVVFSSTPFLLYVRKSNGENSFWDRYSTSSNVSGDEDEEDDESEEEEEITGKKRGRRVKERQEMFQNDYTSGPLRKKKKLIHKVG